LLVAAPAAAAPQSWNGYTVDVMVFPAGESGLGETAHVIAAGGSGLQVTTGAPVTAATVFELTEGAAVLATCTINVTESGCSVGIPSLSAGAHTVAYGFNDGTDSTSFGGTLFAVDGLAPQVRTDWQDA